MLLLRLCDRTVWVHYRSKLPPPAPKVGMFGNLGPVCFEVSLAGSEADLTRVGGYEITAILLSS